MAIDLQYFNFHIYMPVGSWPGKAKELLPPNRANYYHRKTPGSAGVTRRGLTV